MKVPYLLSACGIAFGAVLTAVVCGFFHWPVAPTALLFLLILPLAGVLLTADDDLPGGWSNPDGTVRPPWRRSGCWADIVFRLALVFGVFAVTESWIFWIPGSCALLASLGLLRWSARQTHSTNDSYPTTREVSRLRLLICIAGCIFRNGVAEF